MSAEMMTRHSEDEVECVCGNRPHLDGFYCSDPDGTIRSLRLHTQETDGAS